MENSGFLDILILAMIAAFLVFRLRAALGRRTGRQRPPEGLPREAGDSGDTVIQLPDRKADSGKAKAGARPRGSGEPPPLPEEEAEKQAPSAPGMTELKILDPAFDEEKFLEGAHIAFEMVVEAFAGGDKAQLETLLTDSVLAQFAEEIDRRAAAGEIHETTLVSFAETEILSARTKDGLAGVTVRFVTEQVNLARDAEKEIVSGDERTVRKITDVWTFARDTRSEDPNWRLIETRSEA